jgi:pseudouridine-5'-phosphate glycosidase
MKSSWMEISEEVSNALKQQQPVVALESTIISHGMPWPRNMDTALEVEAVVKSNGAVPATIAIIAGKLKVGLSKGEIELLAKEKNVWKVSLRDLPFVVSQQLHGATTVAATMRIASMAGIRIFATGGTGGVHRGAEKTMDISADLTEMANTNVAIVSAGVKSILDIGLTLEYLETLGIPVVTFGQDSFPSFYSKESKFQSPLRLDTEKELADMLKVKWDLGLQGSVLIANPLADAHAIEPEKIESYILDALNDAHKLNIKGKEITPHILSYIANHSSGESLEANIALIKSNAALAARIAVCF